MPPPPANPPFVQRQKPCSSPPPITTKCGNFGKYYHPHNFTSHTSTHFASRISYLLLRHTSPPLRISALFLLFYIYYFISCRYRQEIIIPEFQTVYTWKASNLKCSSYLYLYIQQQPHIHIKQIGISMSPLTAANLPALMRKSRLKFRIAGSGCD